MEKKSSFKLGKWSKTENDKFIKALEKYGKNWDLIHKFVATRSMSQVRSHAQKLFLGMTKNQAKSFEKEIENRFENFCRGKENRERKKERRSSMKTSTTENCQIKGFQELDRNQNFNFKEQNHNEQSPIELQSEKATKQENKNAHSVCGSISVSQRNTKKANMEGSLFGGVQNQNTLNLACPFPSQYGFYIIPQASFIWMPY